MAISRLHRHTVHMKTKMIAAVYSFIIMSSLSSEILAQQLLQGQTHVVNTVVTSGDDTSSLLGGFNSIYNNNDNSNFNNDLTSFDGQTVQGQVLAPTGTVQYPQNIAQVNYPQIQTGIQTNTIIPQSGSQIYPAQVGNGFQPQNYGPMFGNNRRFNANYWTGSYNNLPKVLPVQHRPVINPHQVIHRPMVQPAVVMPRRSRGKGFLGGTGSGVVKGVLGAVLAGVVAGKVASRGK